MLLANGINFPLVAALGLVTFGPLTLLVTAVEALVFNLRLKTGFRTVFKRVLVANILSTIAGGVILMFQDTLVHATGIRESIPAFVRGYRWVAPLLIAVYFAKSVLVEGLWLTRRRFLTRIERPAGGALRTVLLANVCSYLIVGPLFYYTTRPHFAGLETTYDTRWTANPDSVVYYIDTRDRFIKRTRAAGGEEVVTLVPYPAKAFIVSEDESTFAFIGADRGFYAYRAGHGEPTLILRPPTPGWITTVSISPDNQRIAYLESSNGPGKGDQEMLHTFELASGERIEIGRFSAEGWGTPIAWSATGDELYVQRTTGLYDLAGGVRASEARSVLAFNAVAPYGLQEVLTKPPPESCLVVNFGRVRGHPMYRGEPTVTLPESFTTHGYDVQIYPYLGSGVLIERENQTVLFLQNQYGLLNMSMPPVWSGLFLPTGDELLLEWWEQLYVLSLPQRKLGLLVRGEHFVLRTPEFRVAFETGANR